MINFTIEGTIFHMKADFSHMWKSLFTCVLIKKNKKKVRNNKIPLNDLRDADDA